MLSVGWGHGYAKLIWGAWLRTGGCEVLLREDDRVAAIVRVDQVDQVAEVVGEPELRGRLVPGLNVPPAAVLAGPAPAATCWRPRGPNPVKKCGSGPSVPCPTHLQCECDHVAGDQVACWYQLQCEHAIWLLVIKWRAGTKVAALLQLGRAGRGVGDFRARRACRGAREAPPRPARPPGRPPPRVPGPAGVNQVHPSFRTTCRKSRERAQKEGRHAVRAPASRAAAGRLAPPPPLSRRLFFFFFFSR